MNDDFLKIRLQRVARRYHWLAFWRKLAVCWAAAALVGAVAVWLQRATGWSSPFSLPALAALAGAFATGLAVRHFERRPDLRWVAKKIEQKHPELNGVLLTAVQNGLRPGAELGFLQYRVIQEATARSQQHDWRQVVPTARLVGGQVVHLVALACLVLALGGLREPAGRSAAPKAARRAGRTPMASASRRAMPSSNAARAWSCWPFCAKPAGKMNLLVRKMGCPNGPATLQSSRNRFRRHRNDPPRIPYPFRKGQPPPKFNEVSNPPMGAGTPTTSPI